MENPQSKMDETTGGTPLFWETPLATQWVNSSNWTISGRKPPKTTQWSQGEGAPLLQSFSFFNGG